MIIFKQKIVCDIIDANIWMIGYAGISAYFFPKLGMDPSYGSFMAVTSIATCGFFEVWAAATSFIGDLCGNKTISYPLTLPIPSWLIFVKNALVYGCWCMAITIVILPLGKLLLWNKLDLTNFSPIKFIVMFFFSNLFLGFFAVFIASLVKNLYNVGTIWMRIIFPLWILGCSHFTWQTMHQVSPTLAYINFANPLMYPMEGIRSTVLGQQGSLPFLFCLAMICLSSIIFCFIGIARMKKRLDFV